MFTLSPFRVSALWIKVDIMSFHLFRFYIERRPNAVFRQNEQRCVVEKHGYGLHDAVLVIQRIGFPDVPVCKRMIMINNNICVI